MRLVRLLLVLIAGAACDARPLETQREAQRSEPAIPPTKPALTIERWAAPALANDARMAVIADVAGTGEPQIVLASASTLRVITRDGRELASRDVPAGVQVLGAADLDGEGVAILAGFGRDRDHPRGEALAAIYRLRDGRLDEAPIVTPQTERAEIVALEPWPRDGRIDLFVAYFDSRYHVTSAIARQSATGWTLEPLARLRMAMSYALGDVRGDGSRSLVVGRVYGDDLLEDGDAFLLEPSGARLPIPTTRGVRGLVLTDLDGDGRAEILLGDGWHRDYGTIARGQLTVARLGPSGIASETVVSIPGQYTLWQLEPMRVGDEVVVIARGSDGVFAIRRERNGWTHTALAGEARHVAVGELDGAPGDELLVLTDPPEVIRLAK
jgi:hypothetical protein